MTYQPPPPVGGPVAAGGTDRSQLLGIIGIVVGLLCCSIVGIVLGIISIIQANKYGSNKLWGILAIVAGILNALGGITYAVTQNN